MAYLLHASLLLAGFVSFYWLLLRRETFYRLNRWLLLSSIALSLLLPLISMPPSLSLRNPEVSTLSVLEPMNEVLFIEEEVPVLPANTEETNTIASNPSLAEAIVEVQAVEEAVSPETSALSLATVIKFLYLTGVLIFTIVFLAQLVVLLARRLTLNAVKTGKYTVVELVKDHEPYSFLNTIFINPNNYDRDTYEHIFEHEKIHVDQAHFIDKLIAELLVILFWFNPFVWMLRSLLSKNLEFLTDSSLLKKGVEKENYQLSLLKVSTSNQPFNLTTSYNNSFLKNRIQMMNAKKSNISSSWKYLFLLPLFLLSAMSLNAVRGEKIESTPDPVESNQNSIEEENKKRKETKKSEIKNITSDQKSRVVTKPQAIPETQNTLTSNSSTSASLTTKESNSPQELSEEELAVLMATELSKALQNVELDNKINSAFEQGIQNALETENKNLSKNQESAASTHIDRNQHTNVHVDIHIEDKQTSKKSCTTQKQSCDSKSKEYDSSEKNYDSGTSSFYVIGRTLDLPPINQIGVEDDFKVYLTKGSKQSIKVEGPSHQLEELSQKVRGGKWNIKYKNKLRLRDRGKAVVVYITLPEVTAVASSGASKIIGKGKFKTTDPISIAASGASKIELKISSPKSNVAVSGSARLSLEGKCAFMKAAISGSSRLDAEDFETDECKIVVSGSGSARTHVNNYLNGVVSGTASIRYNGNPEVSKVKSGLGSIRKI